MYANYSATMAAKLHQMPGSFVYEGMTFNCQTNEPTLDKVKTYPLTKDDVVISTYIKSGTTWIQEVVYLIEHDGQPDETTDLAFRVPALENDVGGMNTMEMLKEKPGQKLLKTHLPYKMYKTQVGEGKAKFVVVMRNIRDNLVSVYHFYKMNKLLGNFKGTWDEFFPMFKEKQIFGGDWLDFNLGWWEQRQRKNVHIVMFEDMKQDPISELQKLTQFLGRKLSDECIAGIAARTSFKAMKDNPNVNCSKFGAFLDFSISPFMRKGDVGDWKNYFNAEQLKYIADNYESKAKKVGLNFKYEI